MEECGEEEEEERNMENELLNAIMVEETRETDAAMGEGTWKAACGAQSTKAGGDPFGESELEVGQKGLSEGSASCWKLNWDCSRDENNLEEGDVMDWLEDDEMMKQWEEVSKDEEKICEEDGGKSLQGEGAHRKDGGENKQA